MQNGTIDTIRDIDQLITNSKKIPMTNMVMVDKEQMRRLLAELNDGLPEDIKQAENVVKNESNIINEARDRAEKAVAEAKMTAEKLKSDSEQQAQNTLNAAEGQARDLELSARQQYDQAINQAHQQADDIVTQAQQQADQLVSQQEILKRAQVEASELQQKTHEDMEALRNQIFDYLDGVFAETDRAFSEQLNALRLKRQELNATR